MCPELSGIYDSAHIQPVVRVRQNLSIYTKGQYSHYITDFIEGIPPSPASIVDVVTTPPVATNIAASGTIAKRIVPALQMNDLELLHVRFEPLDNVEGIIWEQAGSLRFNSRSINARVDFRTKQWDPTLATTTFWVLGLNRDMMLEARNPMPYALPMARFIFWGFRYLLTELVNSNWTAEQKALLAKGDRQTVRDLIGETTWIPAEGR